MSYNYTITSEAQTLSEIMGDAYDGTKSYTIYVNQCAPAVLQIIPADEDGGQLAPYDGSRGIELPEFTNVATAIGAMSGDAAYYKSSTNSDINVFIMEYSS